MRRRPLFWLAVSALCFLGAIYFWRLGNQWQFRAISRAALATQAAARPAAALASTAGPASSTHAATNQYQMHDPRVPYRVSNSSRTYHQLLHSDSAILLQNAVIDTGLPIKLPIPASLRAQGDPGSYVVQARGPTSDAFRKALTDAGGTVVSYIPNNAYLVRIGAAGEQQLAANPLTQSVTPFEPYYKLSLPLLTMTMEERPLAPDQELKVVGYPNERSTLQNDLQQIGGQITGEDWSPFGPVFTVGKVANAVASVASLPSVQLVEIKKSRILANDLSRQTLTVAADTQTTSNYLNLTGSNVLVAVDDLGIDATHPDLAGRVSFFDPAMGLDTSGHGTHVAGTIAGNGSESDTVTTNASGSLMPGVTGQFRGMAPEANLLSLNLSMSDFALQQTAARSNAPIENNSWNYGVNEYDIAAASYDWAVRDADPFTTGSQQLNIIFAAGNAGFAPDDSGQGGNNDSILSPATAKNVITVGAVEQARFITNETVIFPLGATNSTGTNAPAPVGTTNTPWFGETDSSDQVAGFSSRGNVGVNVEGDFGRFKPDVVAPGTFVISDRSEQWDQAAYFSPVSHITTTQNNLTNQAFGLASGVIPIPGNAIQIFIQAVRHDGGPQSALPIYLATTNFPNPPAATDIPQSGNNPLIQPLPFTGDTSIGVDSLWFYAITNISPQSLAYDLTIDIEVTNNLGNTLEVESNLDASLGPWYRYETGTSMAAANASGVMALMKEFCNEHSMSNASPALLKALMINGARSLGNGYNFQVQNDLNLQGWGIIQLTNSIPASLFSNSTAQATLAFDQDPTNVLSTGESQTHVIQLSPGARFDPLKVTLVWTDPPGNPSAGVKLVNDLDLIVTDLDSPSNVYYGNDISADFNNLGSQDTNGVPNIDSVNNVENVFLNAAPFLSSRYEITVLGHRVNVNAVTSQTNVIGQDYALVISCGDPNQTDAFTVTTTSNLVVNTTNITVMTNAFAGDPQDFGGVLLGQHVGANLPLLASTNGQSSQWHFYVITNVENFTNAAFVTFLPQTLSVPRMGVTNTEDPSQITRPEADVDLYASTDPNLLGLDPVAIAGALKSVGRGGTETIVTSNAQPGVVYYIGVKSEDQEGAEFGILSVFSQFPFLQVGPNGQQILRGLPVPVTIPDGSPTKPGGTLLFAIDPEPITVQRVVVTNVVTHQQFGQLLGNLSHDQAFVVLNNHSDGNGQTNQLLIYEDNGQGDIEGSRPSDGPGSLKNFIGNEGVGVWMLTMVDNVPTGTGQVDNLTIRLDPQNINGGTQNIPPGGTVFDSVDVPLDATNLIICVLNQSASPASLGFAVRRGALPTFSANTDDLFTNITEINFCTSINPFTTPPLNPGKYFIGVFNPPGNQPQTVSIQVTIEHNASGVAPRILADTNVTTVADDAVTDLFIQSDLDQLITSLSVGIRLDTPRLADLALTLISPNGTRVSLMENRGNLSTNGAGSQAFGFTNWVGIYTNGFDDQPVGPYAAGTKISDWSVLSNIVDIVAEPGCACDTNKAVALGYGVISNSIPITNAGSYQISFRVNHTTNLFDTVAWWPFDSDERDVYGGHERDIYGGHDTLDSGGFTFAPGEVGNALFADGATTLIEVPRGPDLDVGRKAGFTVEGWIYPLDLSNAMPIVEWNDPTNKTAPGGPAGVQFWLDGFTNGAGSGILAAALWSTNYALGDTNLAFTSNKLFTVAGTITNGVWQHVALTYDNASGLASLYVNGALATNSIINGQLLTNSFVTNTLVPRTDGDLYFASHPAGPLAGRTFNGGLDEFGLYSRALSPVEITNIFSAGAAGKYRHDNGTNAYTAPVIVEVDIPGVLTTTFTNGIGWFTNGPQWETNLIVGTNTLVFTNALTNGLSVILRGIDPNAVVDTFTVSELEPTIFNGYLNFSEDASEALTAIKFAPTPYVSTASVVTNVFTNDFDSVPVVGQANFQTNAVFGGWTVTNGMVAVVSNSQFAATGTNFLVLATGAITRQLDTIPGARYQLFYALRGPCMVSWWNGDRDPLTGRLKDLINLNDGAMINGATNFAGLTNAPGTNIVGTNFAIFGTTAIILTNPPLSKVELGDPGNLALTNSFTIEGWIDPIALPATGAVAQVFWRGDERACHTAYSLGLTDAGVIRFHIGDSSGATCGVDLDGGTNVAIAPFEWHHVTAVFDGSGATNVMQLYLDGALVAQTNVGIWPIAGLDPTFAPGVSIGNHSREDYSEPFDGVIDELSVYGRAITASEVEALDQAMRGGLGKSDPAVAPPDGLSEIELSIDGVVQDIEHGNNVAWETHSITFTATATNTTLTLTGLEPGTLVDSFVLAEEPGDVFYLPEEALKKLIGESALGTWTLEIRDDWGGIVGDLSQVLGWQLNITAERTTQPPGAVTLQHGIPYSTVLAGHSVQNFIVNVPLWAQFATNTLHPFATLPVSITYNATNFPAPTDLALIGPLPGGAQAGSVVLSEGTNSVVPLVPGTTYYLALTNLNALPVRYSFEVDFDITVLPNCTSVTNFTGPAGVPRYFAYDVPALAPLPDAATFWLHGARTNLTLVVHQGLPLPDLGNHDYISDLPNTNDQIIAIRPDSTPFPLTTGTWYIGVFSDATTNVPFTFDACYCTNCPSVLELTNAIEQDFTLAPLVTNRMFWHFAISNTVTTNLLLNAPTNIFTNVPASVLFEVYNLNGNADLLLQRFVLPLQAPFFAGSFRLGTTPEQIVIRTNADLPSLTGDWYLGVPNNETNLVFGTIRARLNTNGILISGQPLVSVLSAANPPAGPTLHWTAVEGEHYEISIATNLAHPFMVLTSPVVATSPDMGIQVPSLPFSFFKVRQIP